MSKNWILFAAAFCSFAFAEMRADIFGVVRDTSGSPVDSARVTLKNRGLETLTDSDGTFRLKEETAAIREGNLFRSEGKTRTVHFAEGMFLAEGFDMNGRKILSKSAAKNFSDAARAFRISPDAAKREVSLADTLVVEKSGFFSWERELSSAFDTVEVVLEAFPVASIQKRGAGSSSQSVEQGASIVEFSFAFENAESVIVEGLPKGIVARVDSAKKLVAFSGKALDEPGRYTYTLRTVGGYTEASRQGTFAITEKRAVPFEADGYAMVDGKTTGGAGGDTVEVSTYADFKKAVQSSEKKVVVVKGTIRTTDGDGYGLRIAKDKTIMGKDSAATIYGGIAITGVSNVIVYNLNIHGTYPNPGPSDGIAVSNSHHVWLTHLNIWDAEDGNLDITNQSNYVTVSWVKFWYTDKNHPHRLNALIGSGAADHPEDYGKLKVTYHHNWFGTLVNERMPRVMYGNAHIYNNYYNAPGNLYCIGVGSYASALIEGNYFKDVNSPHLFMYNIYANMVVRENHYDNVTGNRDSGALGERYITTEPYTLIADPVTLDSVPYDYTLDGARDVPAIVMKNAGPHNL